MKQRLSCRKSKIDRESEKRKKRDKAANLNLTSDGYKNNEKEYQLRKYLTKNCEERQLIERAKYNWEKLRRKRKVLVMMWNSGEDINSLVI